MVVVRLISAIMASSLYLALSPFLLIYLLIRGEQPQHEYARRKEETRAEPAFALESAARVELFRKCVGKSVAVVPVRRVQSTVRSGKLVPTAAQTKNTILHRQLRTDERGKRTDASLRRVRSNTVRHWQTKGKGSSS